MSGGVLDQIAAAEQKVAALGAAMAGAGGGAAVSAGLGLAEKLVAQVHAGAKFDGKVTFDLPGPFDPVIDVQGEVRFDDGHLRIKELHIKPSLA